MPKLDKDRQNFTQSKSGYTPFKYENEKLVHISTTHNIFELFVKIKTDGSVALAICTRGKYFPICFPWESKGRGNGTERNKENNRRKGKTRNHVKGCKNEDIRRNSIISRLRPIKAD